MLDTETTGSEAVAEATADAPIEEATDQTTEGSEETASQEEQAAETDPEDDHVEVEREGKKYRIPKALEGELMMRADHTRKTQEVAQQRQALEQERATLHQQAQAMQAYTREVGQVQALNERLADFETYDWQAYMAQSPQEAQAAWMEYQQVEKQRDKLVQSVTAKQQEQALQAQRENAKRLEQDHAELTRDIKGWGPDLGREVLTHATTAYGLDEAEVRSFARAGHIKALHDAMQWRKHQATEAQKAKVLAQQKTQPAHTSRGQGGRFEVSGDTDDFAAFERMAKGKMNKPR